MKEQKFPIYFFGARWSEDGVQDPKYPKWYEGLPEGRVWNSTGFHKMFREEQTQEQLDAFVQDWWKRFLVSKNEEDSRSKIIIRIENTVRIGVKINPINIQPK